MDVKKLLMSDSLEERLEARQFIHWWQHAAINYLNDGKSLEEAVAIANKKYSVDFDERFLYG